MFLVRLSWFGLVGRDRKLLVFGGVMGGGVWGGSDRLLVSI